MGNYHLIIVAGGSGSRFGSEIPKQFINLNHVPIIIHSIRSFLETLPEIKIVIAIHPEHTERLNALLNEYELKAKVSIVMGGNSRFQSVKNGLHGIKDEQGMVGIHDAARPLVSNDCIRNCFVSAEQYGSGIPVVEVKDSIRLINGDQSNAVDRSLYRIVQTPQCFDLKELRSAFEVDDDPKFTDDATVWEHSGRKVKLVSGNPENIKITHPSDIPIAEVLLKRLHDNR